MNVNNSPIILLVSERSGSNLLRTLLGNHSKVCAPVAPHFITEFYPIRNYYGDIRQRETAIRLLSDMQKLANHPYHDWQIEHNSDMVMGVNSVVTAFDAMYREKARQTGSKIYCSKGIDSFQYIDALRSELPSARFVHLVRDPRDHVASWMQRPIQLLTPLDAISKWIDEQSILLDAVKSRGLICHSMRYEDLISDTEKVMTGLLEYLELEVETACFSTDAQNSESDRNPYWKNLSKPIMKDNKRNYLEKLSANEIELIETLAVKEMKSFGYSFETECNWKLEKNTAKELEERKKKSEEMVANRADKNHNLLKDKWRLMDEIRASLNIKSDVRQDKKIRVIHNSSVSLSGKIGNRFKFLLLAIFGTKFTNFIFSKNK